MFNPPQITTDGEPSPIRLRAVSLGAGVQSTTMALMAAHGDIGPMPDCAIFADTGWEPRAVYEHLEWLRSPNVLPFPVHIVSVGNIREQLMAAGEGQRWASIPAFTRTVTPAGAEMPVLGEDDDGEIVPVGTRRMDKETVSIGMIRRQCTTEFKIVPIIRKVRELVGLTRKRSPDHAVGGTVDRDIDGRDHPGQTQFGEMADQTLPADRAAYEPSGLPRLAASA